jgi:hypothetical protein
VSCAHTVGRRSRESLRVAISRIAFVAGLAVGVLPWSVTPSDAVAAPTAAVAAHFPVAESGQVSTTSVRGREGSGGRSAGTSAPSGLTSAWRYVLAVLIVLLVGRLLNRLVRRWYYRRRGLDGQTPPRRQRRRH